jgi:hypothetical protein
VLDGVVLEGRSNICPVAVGQQRSTADAAAAGVSDAAAACEERSLDSRLEARERKVAVGTTGERTGELDGRGVARKRESLHHP